MLSPKVGNGVPIASGLLCMLLACALSACAPPTGPAAPKNTGTALSVSHDGTEITLADFEKADTAMSWVPLATSAPTSPDTQPATAPSTAPTSQPAPTLRRSSLRPQAGLWSMSVPLTEAGEIRRTFATPIDLSKHNLLTAQVAQAGTPAHNGTATAAIILIDDQGKRAEGDAFPVEAAWRGISIDLDDVRLNALNTGRIASVGILYRPAASAPSPAETQPDDTAVMLTDTWVAKKDQETLAGDRANPRTLFISSNGSSISIRSTGRFELLLTDRGATFSDGKPQPPKPWLDISPMPGTQTLAGVPPGGLMLLDSDAFQSLADFRETGPDDANGRGVAGVHAGWHLPETSWPQSINTELTRIKWEVVWTSPIAAIIEGKQENGPFDHLGEPAVQATWRLMVYQWGQVFVHVEWSTSPELHPLEPITWALMQNDNRHNNGIPLSAPDAVGQHRVQELIYPAPVRAGLATALPHRMQTDAPISMVARTNARKDTWWWASGKMSETSTEFRRYFGAGIVAAQGDAGRKRADCMLLVNGADALLQASCFGQYLAPPKVVMRQGELDLTYPGDADGDGFVEPYGFQAIRLANGRATFTIYPQERPIFYPAFLFTVPAAEREAVDIKHSRMLITIDGKLFADPPQFPDGSFLLQLPYEIDQPVSVEAIVVKK